MEQARRVTGYISGKIDISGADAKDIEQIKTQIPTVKVAINDPIIKALNASELATSNNGARQLLNSGAIYINQEKTNSDNFKPEDFINGYLLLRKGKAYKDSALVELIK